MKVCRKRRPNLRTNFKQPKYNRESNRRSSRYRFAVKELFVFPFEEDFE